MTFLTRHDGSFIHMDHHFESSNDVFLPSVSSPQLSSNYLDLLYSSHTMPPDMIIPSDSPRVLQPLGKIPSSGLLNSVEQSIFNWWVDELDLSIHAENLRKLDTYNNANANWFPSLNEPSAMKAPVSVDSSRSVPIYSDYNHHHYKSLIDEGFIDHKVNEMKSLGFHIDGSKSLTSLNIALNPVLFSPKASTRLSSTENDVRYIESRKKVNKSKRIKLSDIERRQRHLESEKRRRFNYQESINRLQNALPQPQFPDRNQGELIWRGIEYVKTLESEIFILSSKKNPSLVSSKEITEARGIITLRDDEF